MSFDRMLDIAILLGVFGILAIELGAIKVS